MKKLRWNGDVLCDYNKEIIGGCNKINSQYIGWYGLHFASGSLGTFTSRKEAKKKVERVVNFWLKILDK